MIFLPLRSANKVEIANFCLNADWTPEVDTLYKAVLIWMQIELYRLSCGESHGNDNVHRSRRMIPPNPEVQ